MSDLVERLRRWATTQPVEPYGKYGTMSEAADHIERLGAALREIAETSSLDYARRKARAALAEETGE